MPYIGNIHIPFPTADPGSKERPVEEHNFVGAENIVSEFERGLESGDIPFFTTKAGHDRSETLEEQYEAIRSLIDRNAPDNPIEFLDKRGHLTISSVNHPRTPNTTLREGTLTIKYLPDSLYQPAVTTTHSDVSNDFGASFYGVFYLPDIAENIRIRSATTGDYTPLSRLTTRTDESGSTQDYAISTEKGGIAPYTTEFFINAVDAGTSDGTDQYDSSAHGLQTHRLDSSGENISETFDAPDGDYSVVIRAKAGTSGDEISINGTTNAINSTSFTTVSETLTASDSTITPDVSWVSGQVDVDYILLVPQNKPQVTFDYPTDNTTIDGASVPSYNVGSHQDVRILDTNESTTESDWSRVYDEGHSFDGDMVIENGLLRVAINDATNGDIRVYYWDGSQYTESGRVSLSGSNTASNQVVQTIYPRACKVEFTLNGSKQSIKVEKGRYNVLFNVTGSTQLEYDVGYDNAFIPGNNIAGTGNSITKSVTSETDNYATGFTSGENAVFTISKASNDGGVEVSSGVLKFTNLTSSSTYKTWFSTLPVTTTRTTNSSLTVVGDTGTPLGTYVAFSLASFSNTSDEWSLDVENVTDSSTVDIDGNGVSKSVTESGSLTFYTRAIRINADDEGDNITVSWTQNSGTGSITVDHIGLIPISLLTGGNQLGPQDLAHQSLVDPGDKAQLLNRRAL